MDSMQPAEGQNMKPETEGPSFSEFLLTSKSIPEGQPGEGYGAHAVERASSVRIREPTADDFWAPSHRRSLSSEDELLKQPDGVKLSRPPSHKNITASESVASKSRIGSVAGHTEVSDVDEEEQQCEQSHPRRSAEMLDRALLDSVTDLQHARSVVWDGEQVVLSGDAGPKMARRHTSGLGATDNAGTQANQVADQLLQAQAMNRRGTFADGSVQHMITSDKEVKQARVKGISYRHREEDRQTQAMDPGSAMPFVSMQDMKKFAAEHQPDHTTDIPEDMEHVTFRERSANVAKAVGNSLLTRTKTFLKTLQDERNRYDGIEEEKDVEAGPVATLSPRPKPGEHDQFSINVPLSLERFKFPISIYDGHMSKVLVAIDMAEKQPVVLRRYATAELNVEQSMRLGNEIKLLEKITSGQDHGLVEYRGCFTTDEHIYIVTENCTQGDLLRELTLAPEHKLSDDFVRGNVLPCLLDALTYLHSQGIAHCDIKPENLFSTSNGKVKLGDLHYACEVAKEPPVHREGLVDYMAPEMLLMRTAQEKKQKRKLKLIRHFDEKADIWQVGILTYELLTGITPFEAEDIDTTAALILWGELDAFPIFVSEGAIDFMKQCLKKNPADRPAARNLKDHPWLKQNLFAKLNVFGAKKEESGAHPGLNHMSTGGKQKKNQFMNWLVPGFAEMKFNEAETVPRNITPSGFGLNERQHEYISDKDNNAVLRGAVRVAGWLGLNKTVSPRTAEMRKAFADVGTNLAGSAAVSRAARVADKVIPEDITV